MNEENVEEIQSSSEDLFSDYTVSAYFPSNEPYYYNYLIEHRIMILSAESLTLHPGERCISPTNLKMSITRSKKHSYYLQENPKLSLRLENEGFIHPNFRGRLNLNLVNISSHTIQLPAGFILGYLLISPNGINL